MSHAHYSEGSGGWLTFFRKEQPSVRRALPPVGWHSTVEQPLQMTTLWAWLKTVVLRNKTEPNQN